MSNETDAVKLARNIVNNADVAARMAWTGAELLPMARALLATPQAEPQDEDVKRAYNLIENNLPKPMNWKKGCRAGLVNEIAAEFAAIRAEERAKGSAEIEQLKRERDGEREARERIDIALRQKDAAMGVLFNRLRAAGVDCSDLIS